MCNHYKVFMPSNKNAGARYLIIDDCITNPLKKYPTLEYLLEKINDQGHDITKHSVSKDIEYMKKEFNAPIAYSNLNRGYEYTEKEFSLKKFPLIYEEITALDFSTALLSKLKGSSLYGHFESAIEKIIHVNRLKRITKDIEKLILQPEEAIQNKGNNWIAMLLKAIVEKDCLNITYQSHERAQKIHAISPYLLREYEKLWYLIGWKHRK